MHAARMGPLPGPDAPLFTSWDSAEDSDDEDWDLTESNYNVVEGTGGISITRKMVRRSKGAKLLGGKAARVPGLVNAYAKAFAISEEDQPLFKDRLLENLDNMSEQSEKTGFWSRSGEDAMDSKGISRLGEFLIVGCGCSALSCFLLPSRCTQAVDAEPFERPRSGPQGRSYLSRQAKHHHVAEPYQVVSWR